MRVVMNNIRCGTAGREKFHLNRFSPPLQFKITLESSSLSGTCRFCTVVTRYPIGVFFLGLPDMNMRTESVCGREEDGGESAML